MLWSEMNRCYLQFRVSTQLKKPETNIPLPILWVRPDGVKYTFRILIWYALPLTVLPSNMQLLLCLLCLVQFVVPVLSVKHWMFRKCEQNPFCKRGREHAAQGGSEYAISSIKQGENQLYGFLGTDNGQQLSFSLQVVMDGALRFIVDEPDRHVEAEHLANARFDPDAFMLDISESRTIPDTKIEIEKDKATIYFGEAEATLYLKPLKLVVARAGEPLVVLNEHKLLHMETLRVKADSDDSTMWEDSFDGHTDKKVRGPESVAADFGFPGARHVYGIPEHSDSLLLKDTRKEHTDPYRLFNVDIFEYETESEMPMYGSIPFMLGLRPDASAGVLWLNSADTYIDITKESDSTWSHWMSETGKIDSFIFVGSDPSEVVSRYSQVVGTTALPQLWAIAYHQCRWNYNSDTDVLNVNRQFDNHGIPYDVIWLDIEYTDQRKYFLWNPHTFPDPEKMLFELDDTKRKLVPLIDPHIKVASDYEIYEDVKNVAVQNAEASQPFQGHCWPGNSIWIDTMNPECQKYWNKFHAMGAFGGHAPNLGIWNDMSEPSVFSGSETTAYKDLVHYGGWQHRDVHNLFGQTFTNATFEALLQRYDYKQRPFILTRSFFAGSQRLAATWTGDNQAEWEYLRAATPTILTLGVAGMPFSGADVGGFFRDPEPELLVRWYQSGLFYPFFRAHAHEDSKRREPYLLSPPYNNTIAASIQLRYQLLPQFYTAFWESSHNLAPVMRPVWWEYPSSEDWYDVEDSFLIGSDLYAHPVTSKDAVIDLKVPPGTWYDYFTGEKPSEGQRHVALEKIPLYVRGGSVVFRRDRVRRSSELMKQDPYTLLVALNDNGTAKGTLYVDDGISYAYKSGKYLITDVSFADGVLQGVPRQSSREHFANVPIERVIFYGLEKPSKASTSGNALDVIPQENGFIVRNPRVKIGEAWEIKLD